MTKTLLLDCGSGGRASQRLINELFLEQFDNPILRTLDDAAKLELSGPIAMSTDGYTVTPLFFPGGNIGTLAVHGTVNDVSMLGARPRYLTCGFILEEGADSGELAKIAVSMAETAQEAGVLIVAGDTKVVQGKGGVFINTAGVGFVPEGISVSASACQEGDVVLVSGFLGEHHAAILSSRMGIENEIRSDCAPLNEMVAAMRQAGVRVHAMRDVTRGGLATVLHEFAVSSGCCVELEQNALPISGPVKGFCGLLGLDPLYMGNEGKMTAVVDARDAGSALACMQKCRYGEHAAVIGRISHKENGKVLLHTSLGGLRVVPELIGEGLPRIC